MNSQVATASGDYTVRIWEVTELLPPSQKREEPGSR
jgi:hypothetical protein